MTSVAMQSVSAEAFQLGDLSYRWLVMNADHEGIDRTTNNPACNADPNIYFFRATKTIVACKFDDLPKYGIMRGIQKK